MFNRFSSVRLTTLAVTTTLLFASACAMANGPMGGGTPTPASPSRTPGGGMGPASRGGMPSRPLTVNPRPLPGVLPPTYTSVFSPGDAARIAAQIGGTYGAPRYVYTNRYGQAVYVYDVFGR